MGVIKKILYRNNILGRPRHHNLFLDMEENIHIHYRDLRIELSRGEFEDFVKAFRRQSDELLALIQEKNYEDGKLPNANQDEVRIWTDARLKSNVKYHPQRFSLEECGDGYHFHYRNCKFLIDPAEFRQIAQLFKTINLDGPYAASYEEVLALLEANEIDFLLDAGNVPGEVLKITVAKHHVPKVRDIFSYIGFTHEARGAELQYRGSHLTVVARVDSKLTALDYRRIRGRNDICRLADYLARQGPSLDANELNGIKCQVLELYFAVKSGQSQNVETDPQTWLYAYTNKQVVFPCNTSGRKDGKDAEGLYRAWSALLTSHQLSFVKPTKEAFAPQEQNALQQRMTETLRKEVASVAAVEKVYLMGSALRADMGRYQAPFVHGKLVKLGSDVDILVEINPTRESDIPAAWQLVNPSSSNHCAVYHVAQIPLAEGVGEWPARYPHVEFTHHLIDAYVFFPSRGYHEEKEAFLRKFGAKLFYDRARDGAINRGEEESALASQIARLYSFSQVVVEQMTVSTQNALYKVVVDNRDYILKLFKVSGNYNHSRIAEHTEYEARLIGRLQERGVQTAGILPSQQGLAVMVDGCSALLFERLPGSVCGRPEYPLDQIGAALANIHRVQMERPLDLAVNFSFEDICAIWLPTFHDYAGKTTHSAEIGETIAKLAPLAERCKRAPDRAALLKRGVSVHNHGDVTPKNVMVDEQGNVRFFDFNNAFFGPRLADVLDGAFEFSLAEKYIDLADFARFDAFIVHYASHSPFTVKEREDLPQWIELMGIIKFTKELRVLLDHDADGLRKRRALAIAEFVLSRNGAR